MYRDYSRSEGERGHTLYDLESLFIATLILMRDLLCGPKTKFLRCTDIHTCLIKHSGTIIVVTKGSMHGLKLKPYRQVNFVIKCCSRQCSITVGI